MGRKIGLTLFMLIFFAIGAFAMGMVIRDSIRNEKARHWQDADARIERSEINESPPYRLNVGYAYDFGGKHYRGAMLSFDYAGSDDYYDAGKLREKYPPGATVTCLVDPTEPGNSVLELTSNWSVLTILLPLIFVLVGGFGVYFTWRPVDVSQPGMWMKLFLPLFFGVFLMMGGGMLVVKFLPALWRAHLAQNWPTEPCVIDHSGVATHVDSDDHGSSTTYSVDVLFEYSFAGLEHKSSRYELNPLSTSDYDSHQRIVNSLPQGAKTTCYVNPKDPADAVIDRSSEGLVLLGGMSILFTLIGAVGEVCIIFSAVAKQRRKHPVPAEHLAGGFVALKLVQRPILMALPAFGFGAFWCGITGFIGAMVAIEWNNGNQAWGPVIFVIIFSAIGVYILGAAFYTSLAALNRKPHVLISEYPVRTGHEVEIRWRFDHPVRLTSMRLKVAGVIVMPNVKLTPYEKRPHFWECDLGEIDRATEIQSGSRKFTIPADWREDTGGQGDRVCAVLVSGKAPGLPKMGLEFLVEVEKVATGVASV